MEDIFAKVGLKSVHLFAGMIGGVFVIYFGKRPTSVAERIRAFFTVILSAISTAYLTPLIILYKPNWESGEHGIAFLIGLFGMGIIHGLVNFINKNFINDPMGTIKKIRDAIRT